MAKKIKNIINQLLHHPLNQANALGTSVNKPGSLIQYNPISSSLLFPTSTIKYKSYLKKVRMGPKSKPRNNIQYSQYILDKGLHLKKWIRLDDMGGRGDHKVWRNAKFMSDTCFLTRYNHKRGPTMYHICTELPRWILYCRVLRGLSKCPECDSPIDEGILMLQNLQKLKK